MFCGVYELFKSIRIITVRFLFKVRKKTNMVLTSAIFIILTIIDNESADSIPNYHKTVTTFAKSLGIPNQSLN